MCVCEALGIPINCIQSLYSVYTSQNITLYTEHMYCCLCVMDSYVKLGQTFEKTWGFWVWLLTEACSY